MAQARFTKFQVYGQRCSGTNALIRLLERNLPDMRFTEEFGFKHWLVPADVRIPDDVFVVVIARPVDQWLRSLHANPWHAHPDLKAMPFADFIRAPWRSVWDEQFWGVDRSDPRFGKPIAEELDPQTGAPFANAIAMRTAKLANWIDTASRARGHLFVSHGELVSNPSAIVRRFANKASTRMAMPFVPVDSYKGQERKPFRPVRHEPLDAADAALVNAFTDHAIEAHFAQDAAEPGDEAQPLRQMKG